MYRQHDNGAGAGEHSFQLPAGVGNSPFSQAQFASPIYGIDPSLQSSSQHLFPMPRSIRQSPHMRQSSVETPGSMQPPPRSISPSMVNNTNVSSFKPTDRSLPARDVTADTIESVYVEFILYCNPNFDLDVDTTTLKSTFNTPPRSDNKDFATFRLFELIRKFDSKEIKTWAQLALDLGVEAPDTSKGQSVQKVQQYTVRLKRWMRAMHVDAFFEYLLGKPHSYYINIPPPSDPYPAAGRDGVLAEEDLAIRALDPSFRPKRGRRRNSDAEQDENGESANKQPRLLDSAAPFSGGQMSAMPMTAHPDAFQDPWAVASAVTPQSLAPWSARSAVTGTNLRWQLGHSQTPSTPHPMSTISTSMSAHIDAAFDGEPRSAVTPSSRRRRKHGPAVSSAWSSGNVPGAKPRGRPPVNRSVQDGPFSTFPADPANEKGKGQMQMPTPISTTTEEKPSIEQATPQTTPPPVPSQPDGRPHRLSLQVPRRTGGPVRLATPPTLLVNGETNETSTRSDSDDPSRAVVVAAPTSVPNRALQQPNTPSPAFSFEALKRVVASDLLRANIIGRTQRLTGDEAKRLADAVLDRLNVPRSATPTTRDDLARITAASWLGVGNQFKVPLGPSAGHGKRINVTRFRTDAEGYEEITLDESTDDVREVFDIYWHVSQGGCMGAFEMKGLSLGGLSEADRKESTHDLILRKGLDALQNLDREGWFQESVEEVVRSVVRTSTASSRAGAANIEDKGGGVDWKAKCKALEFAAMVAKGEAERVQQRLLEKVLDALL